VDEYWAMYDKRGFKDFTEKYGYCLKTPDAFGKIEKEIKEECLA